MPFSIQTTTVEILSDGTPIPAYLAHPVRPDSLPVVVVIQEVFGVNEHIRSVTERIAQEGYIAIAPAIYHRQVNNFEVGYSDADLALGRQYKDGTRASELLADIQGAIAYAQAAIPAVPPKAGCIGFCFGGHVAYLAATLPTIAATASFYGAGIPHFTPGGGEPTLSQTSRIEGTLYAFFGLQDPLIPIADIDTIETALSAANIDHQIFRYPEAGHGFFCDRRSSYHAPSAHGAWHQVKALFQSRLQGPGS